VNREAALVELVDAVGVATGSATVDHAHRAPGLLHRAFSVLLFDDSGRTLLQRRAATKTRFALRWANACCGHPAPGEPPIVAATTRLAEELGLSGIALTAVGVYVYRAADGTTGRVEHEYDHVLIGHLATETDLRPDPAEVAEFAWRHVPDVLADVASARYAPWLAGVLGVGTAGAR
jgi:isopentenyl-diphosphate delta-isomerase